MGSPPDECRQQERPRRQDLHPVPGYRFTLVDMTESEMSAPFPPVACTLPTREQPLRVAEFDALFSSALRRVERRERALLLLTFDTTPGVEATVRDLLAREVRCCSFFTFAVTADPGGLGVEVGVPDTHLDVLDGLAARAAYQAGLAA